MQLRRSSRPTPCPDDPAPVSGPGSPSPVGTPPHVVVVDDEPALLELVGRVLRRDGFLVTLSADGVGVAAGLVRRPALLLTDLVLPGSSGHEVAAAVRARHPGTPVVFASGYGSSGAPGATPGADPVLAKPFTSAELLATVRSAIAGEVPLPRSA